MKNCLHTDCQQSTYAGCLHETMGNGINISDNTGPICANCGKLGHMGCTGVTNKPTWEDEWEKFVKNGYKEKFGLSSSNRLNWGCEECGGENAEEDIKQFISTKLAEQRKEIIEKIEANFNFTVSTTKQDLINLIKQD